MKTLIRLLALACLLATPARLEAESLDEVDRGASKSLDEARQAQPRSPDEAPNASPGTPDAVEPGAEVRNGGEPLDAVDTGKSGRPDPATE